MPHWTEDLFVDHPELFVNTLQERVSIAAVEVRFLLEHLREQGFKPTRILDLNCGIGRHSIELGKQGITVIGTDLSPYYIKMAEECAHGQHMTGKVRFRVTDMRRIGTILAKERFDGIINLFTSFGFYDEETNADILRQCCHLVKSKGFFALEIMNRDWIIRNFQPIGFSRYRNMIVLEDRVFDAKTSRMQTTWTYLIRGHDGNFREKKQVTIDHRVWSLHELIDLFKKAGWKFKAVYSGIRGQPESTPITEVHRLLFIAARAE